MALDPNLSIIAGQAPRSVVGESFGNALLNIGRVQDIQRARAEQPFRNQLLQQQVSAGEQQAQIRGQGIDQQAQLQRLGQVGEIGLKVSQSLTNGDPTSATRELLRFRATIDPSDTVTLNEIDEDLADVQNNPQKLIQEGNQAFQLAQQAGVFADQRGVTGTASQRDFQTFQQLRAKAEQTGDPVDQQAANQFGRQSGFTRETAQELSDIKVGEARGKAEAVAGVELKTQPTIAASKKAATAAITRSEKAFDQIGKIKENVNNLDEVVRLIDEGAATGVVASKLPSIRQASVQLDNLQGRLGLDVIGNTTFGALSESELAFALATALPKNLDGPDLKRWVQRKKDSQLKLSSYLEEVATFLGTPGNTTADFIELQKLKQLDQEQPIAEPAAATVEAQQNQVLRFDAQGNLVQ